jgi:hypothetical protein
MDNGAMPKSAKKSSPSGDSQGQRRYRSVAEIKRDLFPNAAAEETATNARDRSEGLMQDFFGPRHTCA